MSSAHVGANSTGDLWNALPLSLLRRRLLNALERPQELMGHVRGVATVISARAPLAVRAAKRAMVEGASTTAVLDIPVLVIPLFGKQLR